MTTLLNGIIQEIDPGQRILVLPDDYRLLLLVLFAWLLFSVWGAANFDSAGLSPHFMWPSLLHPWVGFLMFAISVCVDLSHKIALRREAKARHEEAQHTLALRLNNMASEATQTIESLPGMLHLAENQIDLAEREFEDGAFAPFWDAIEHAANILIRFDSSVHVLIGKATLYKEEGAKLEGPPVPPFSRSVSTLPDASYTAKRMRTVVRRAQKNFHFACIYEQRRTNQLLHLGFNTLGQAIEELSESLNSSLEQLSTSSDIAIEELEQTREQAAASFRAQRDHEGKEREMLNNIQRRRKPEPRELRDGEY